MASKLISKMLYAALAMKRVLAKCVRVRLWRQLKTVRASNAQPQHEGFPYTHAYRSSAKRECKKKCLSGCDKT